MHKPKSNIISAFDEIFDDIPTKGNANEDDSQNTAVKTSNVKYADMGHKPPTKSKKVISCTVNDIDGWDSDDNVQAPSKENVCEGKPDMEDDWD